MRERWAYRKNYYNTISVLSLQVEDFRISLEKLKTASLSYLSQQPGNDSSAEKRYLNRKDLSVATDLTSQLHMLICDRLANLDRNQLAPGTQDNVGVVIPAVWNSVPTLFVPRGQLELVAVLRRSIQNGNKAVLQVIVLLAFFF